MINSHKIWDQAGIEFTIRGSAVGFSTNCATQSGGLNMWLTKNLIKMDWFWEKQKGQVALKRSP